MDTINKKLLKMIFGYVYMDKLLLKDIAVIRICVGFLGESSQYAWWSSSFFSSAGRTFLMPVFSKTSFSAQYYGVKKAASIIHDDHIGKGEDVFHLFRLAEIYEIEIHKLLENQENINHILGIITNKDSALQFLQDYAGGNEKQVFLRADISKISKKQVWQEIAMSYAQAFISGNKTFPCFKNEK